jgi:hypothetical protein
MEVGMKEYIWLLLIPIFIGVITGVLQPNRKGNVRKGMSLQKINLPVRQLMWVKEPQSHAGQTT